MGNDRYIHHEEAHNLGAPEIIVPVIMDILKPESVVDVGCGIGTFLHVFQKAGVDQILGIDGHWVDRTQLGQYIDATLFMEADLEKELSIERRFDLVISLEVAEHLAESSADTFINTLVSLGDIILFSASIPGQFGQNHLNEQWPDYWKIKFEDRGYEFHDVMRPIFWNNTSLPRWYKQNMFVAAKPELRHSVEGFQKHAGDELKCYVHLEYFETYRNVLQSSEKDKAELRLALETLKSGRESLSLYIKLITKALLATMKGK